MHATQQAAPSQGPVPPQNDTAFLLDKHGREIQVGDLLKVFHFIARVRREKCYMYKHVIARETLGTTQPVPALKISHLDLRGTSYYREILDGRQLTDCEIIQGHGENGVRYADRPKRIPLPLPASTP